jgi:hypothetical protein
LACSDGSGSGCASTHYCLGAGCTPATLYANAITIASSTDLRFRSTDIAGNSEAITTATYTIVAAADYALGLIVSGSGAGKVVSTPAGIDTTTSFSARFSSGSSVSLHATPSTYSYFSGWSGDCSGTADCLLTMTADRVATATFTKDTAHSTYIPNHGGIYSPTIQSAYNAAANNDSILLWGTDFSQDVVCTTDKQVTIRGGYNEAYTTQDGTTNLRGSLSISSGAVTIEMVEIN